MAGTSSWSSTRSTSPDIDYQALIETTDPDQMPGQYQIPTNPTTNSTDPDSTTIEEDNRP